MSYNFVKIQVVFKGNNNISIGQVQIYFVRQKHGYQ
jgi:hypothetical protein